MQLIVFFRSFQLYIYASAHGKTSYIFVHCTLLFLLVFYLTILLFWIHSGFCLIAS